MSAEMAPTGSGPESGDVGFPSVEPPNSYPTNGRQLNSTEPYATSAPDMGLADWEIALFEKFPLDE